VLSAKQAYLIAERLFKTPLDDAGRG